jgi:hypothetical protein
MMTNEVKNPTACLFNENSAALLAERPRWRLIPDFLRFPYRDNTSYIIATLTNFSPLSNRFLTILDEI